MHLCTLKYPSDVNYLAMTPFHFRPCWFWEVVWLFLDKPDLLIEVLLQTTVCPWKGVKKLGMFKARTFGPQAVLQRAKGILCVSSGNKRWILAQGEVYVEPTRSEAQRWQQSPPKSFSTRPGLSFATLHQSQELGSFSSSRDENNGSIGINSFFEVSEMRSKLLTLVTTANSSGIRDWGLCTEVLQQNQQEMSDKIKLKLW